MNTNILPSDRFSVEAVINPQSVDGAMVPSAWVSLAQLGYLCALIKAGVITATGTLDGAIMQATDASGAGAKAVTGKSITQLTSAESNSQALINVSESDLDTANNYTHVRLELTAATAASLVSAELLGFDANYFPKEHAASVVEIV